MIYRNPHLCLSQRRGLEFTLWEGNFIVTNPARLKWIFLCCFSSFSISLLIFLCRGGLAHGVSCAEKISGILILQIYAFLQTWIAQFAFFNSLPSIHLIEEGGGEGRGGKKGCYGHPWIPQSEYSSVTALFFLPWKRLDTSLSRQCYQMQIIIFFLSACVFVALMKQKIA